MPPSGRVMPPGTGWPDSFLESFGMVLLPGRMVSPGRSLICSKGAAANGATGTGAGLMMLSPGRMTTTRSEAS